MKFVAYVLSLLTGAQVLGWWGFAIVALLLWFAAITTASRLAPGGDFRQLEQAEFQQADGVVRRLFFGWAVVALILAGLGWLARWIF